MAITIKKETATQFLVAADNVGEVRGIEKIWSVGDKIYFLQPDGEIFDENYKKISVYDLDAEEPSEINSLAEFLSLLKTIGIANFKTAEASATNSGSISTAKIIKRCPDNAFRNAHGSITIGTTQYYGTRTSPPELIRFPNPNDLTDYQKITLPSSDYGSVEYLVYNEVTGKIYACLSTNKLLVINDIDDISDYDIVDLTISGGVINAGSVILVDDNYIYIGTNGTPNSAFIKLDITDYSEVANVQWIGRPAIHSGVWNADKSVLIFCQNGTVCYRAKINPTDLSYTEKYVGDSITDDIAYVSNIFAYDFFDMVIYPAENRVLGTKGCYVENPDTEQIYQLDCLPSYGIFIDDENFLIYFATIEGSIEVFTFQSIVDSVKGYADPKTASTVYVNTDKNKFNEITKIDGKVFATIWENATSFGGDGKGALVELDLIKIKNGAASKSEQVYRTDKYLKVQYADSVTATSFIDIQFANGDWDKLILKNYGINITPNNSASANAIDKWYPSNKNDQSFRLNFNAPVTATLDLTITINP
jgi:hypothetical protein